MDGRGEEMNELHMVLAMFGAGMATSNLYFYATGSKGWKPLVISAIAFAIVAIAWAIR